MAQRVRSNAKPHTRSAQTEQCLQISFKVEGMVQGMALLTLVHHDRH